MADTKISDMTAAGAAQRNHGTVFPVVNNGTNYKETFDGFATYLNTGFFIANYPTSPTAGSFGETYAKLKVLSGNVLLTGKGILRGDDTTGFFRKLSLGNVVTHRETGFYSLVLGGQYNTGVAGDNHTFLGGSFNYITGDYGSILGGFYNRITGGSFKLLTPHESNVIVHGVGNTINGNFGFIGNGYQCTLNSYGGVIVGGFRHLNTQNTYGFLGGGADNLLKAGTSCVIVAGAANVNSGDYNSIVGGTANSFEGPGVADSSFIGGGQTNIIRSENGTVNSAIIAGRTNLINTSDSALIGAGESNSIITGDYSIVLGGINNLISGLDYSCIVAGSNNRIMFRFDSELGKNFIGAGDYNHLLGSYSFIGAGLLNYVQGDWSTVVGGTNNAARGSTHFIGGGDGNQASGSYNTIGGGVGNTAGLNDDHQYVTVGGGGSNNAYGLGASVFGGTNNYSTGNYTTTVGGRVNAAMGDYSFVGGGLANSGLSSGSVVVGGRLNIAHKTMSSVLGGQSNIASGDYASVVGGLLNIAQSGHSSILAGTRNTVRATGAVIIGGNRNIINTSALSFIGNGNVNTINGTGVSAILQGNSNSIFSGGYNTILNGNNVRLHAGNFNLACGRDIAVNANGNFAFGNNITSNVNGAMVLGDDTTSTKTAFTKESAYLYFASGVNIRGPFTMTSGFTPISQFLPSGQVGQLNWDNSNMYLYRGPTLGWGTIQAPNFGGVGNRTAHPIVFFDSTSNMSTINPPGTHEINSVETAFKYCLDLNSANINFSPVSARLTLFLATAGGAGPLSIQAVYSNDPSIPTSDWTGLGLVIPVDSSIPYNTTHTVTGVVSFPNGLSQVYVKPVAVNGAGINETCGINGLSLTFFGTTS